MTGCVLVTVGVGEKAEVDGFAEDVARLGELVALGSNVLFEAVAWGVVTGSPVMLGRGVAVRETIGDASVSAVGLSDSRCSSALWVEHPLANSVAPIAMMNGRRRIWLFEQKHVKSKRFQGELRLK